MSKSMKRIHKVTVKRMFDDSPDTSHMGEYSDKQTSYIGITAEAEITLTDARDGAPVQTIHSGGLWGIESDSDSKYLASVEQEELANLRGQLHALGFSQRAISAAFRESA